MERGQENDSQPGQTREVNGRWTPRLEVGRQKVEKEGYFYQAVECVFDKICSFGLYVIRYVMFLCFWVQFRTKQTQCFFAYVMLNIICHYVFMFLGMLHYKQYKQYAVRSITRKIRCYVRQVLSV